MSVSVSAERREFRRLTLPLAARFRLRNSRVVRRGTIENISGVGAAILTPVPLPAHGIVEQLRFSLSPESGEDKLEFSIAAEIVTSEQQSFSDSSERYRSGLVFLSPKAGHLDKICKIIERELGKSCRSLPTGEAQLGLDLVPRSN